MKSSFNGAQSRYRMGVIRHRGQLSFGCLSFRLTLRPWRPRIKRHCRSHGLVYIASIAVLFAVARLSEAATWLPSSPPGILTSSPRFLPSAVKILTSASVGADSRYLFRCPTAFSGRVPPVSLATFRDGNRPLTAIKTLQPNQLKGWKPVSFSLGAYRQINPRLMEDYQAVQAAG